MYQNQNFLQGSTSLNQDVWGLVGNFGAAGQKAERREKNKTKGLGPISEQMVDSS